MAVDVIDLLHDLLDPEMLTESLEAAMVLVDGLLKADFVILLTDNLTRLDEGESDEQAEAIHNILGIVENLIELEPSLNDRIVKDTKVLDFALARLRKKPFHPNKLYASEVLGILLQTSEANQQAMVKLHGIDALLVAGEPVLIRLASNAMAAAAAAGCGLCLVAYLLLGLQRRRTSARIQSVRMSSVAV